MPISQPFEILAILLNFLLYVVHICPTLAIQFRNTLFPVMLVSSANAKKYSQSRKRKAYLNAFNNNPERKKRLKAYMRAYHESHKPKL